MSLFSLLIRIEAFVFFIKFAYYKQNARAVSNIESNHNLSSENHFIIEKKIPKKKSKKKLFIHSVRHLITDLQVNVSNFDVLFNRLSVSLVPFTHWRWPCHFIAFSEHQTRLPSLQAPNTLI